MTAIPHPPLAARAISERLLLPLRQIAGRTRVLRATRGILLTAILALSCWLFIALLLGSLSGIPLWARVAFSLGAWFTLGYAVIHFLIPSLGRSGLTQAARMVDSALPDANERISSAIELSEEPDSPHKGSAELVAALVRQAERDAENVDPVAVISSRSVFYAATIALPLAILWLVALAMYPQTMTQGLARIVQPWTTNPPLPMPILTVEPGDKQLPQGAILDISVNVAPPPRAHDVKDFSVARATITYAYASGQQVSEELERTGPASFRKRTDPLQQSFSYTIAADNAQSPTFQVKVSPLPALISADVIYDFPAYIREPRRTELGKDGSLDAPVGTQATVTFHLTQDVTADSSLVLKTRDAKGAPRELTSLLSHKEGRLYTVTLDLIESGHYELQLTGVDGLKNAETISRTVTVRPDAVPEITIVAPQPVMARPGDTVPIKYTTRDDHGITLIEAILQAEGAKEEVQVVALLREPIKTLESLYPLSVPEVLRRAGLTRARQLTYQLRVTDSAEPKRQTGLSQKYTLNLDENAGSPEQQKDRADQSDLTAAIKKASDAADKSQKTADALKQSDKPLTPDQQKQLETAQRELADASKNLAETADSKKQSNFQDIARDAKDAAEKPIQNAADEMARANMSAGNPKARNESLERASSQSADVRQQMHNLQDRLDQAGRQRDTTNGMGDIAEQHRKIAEKERTDPAGAGRDREKLQKELDKLLSQNDNARADLEKAGQEKNEALSRKAEQVADRNSPLVDRAQTAAEAANAGNTRSQIERDQEKFRKDAENFAEKHRDALRQAGATPPDRKRLEQIEKNLTPEKSGDAQRNQEAVADQYEGVADKLDLSARNADRAAGGAQRAADKAAENADKAGDLKQRSDQLAQEIQKAKANNKPPTRGSDPANQKAWELARDLKNAASNFSNQNPVQRQAGVDAAKEADAAGELARAGRAEDAQKKLGDAATKLKAAADQVNEQAQKAASTGPAKAAREAERDARDLSDRQRDLAARTEQVNKAVEKAAGDQKTSGTARQEQQRIADEMDKLAREASALANESKDAAPKSAKAAAQAAEAFKNAAAKQRSVNKAEASGNPENAARDQEAAQENLNRGISSLGGQPRQITKAGTPPAGPTAKSGSRTVDQPGERPGERSPENFTGPDPRTASSQPNTAGGQTASTQKAGPPNDNSETKADPTAANNTGKTPGENKTPGTSTDDKTAGSEPKNGNKPASDPTAGNTASGNDGVKGKPMPEAGKGPAQGQAGIEPKGTDPSNKGATQAGGAKSTAQSGAMDKAAKAGAEASEALRRANATRNPADIARAQQALDDAKAAWDAADAQRQANAGEKTNGVGTAKNGNAPGETPGGPNGSKPSPKIAGGSGEGVNKRPVDTKVPDAVREMGISPGDWARLPPDVQGQLLNAAQQKGPPAYREAIKNYFTRIARMQSTD